MKGHKRFVKANSMPWRPLDSPSQLGSEFRRKTRFLVDEDVGIEIAQFLRQRHYNAIFVGDVGLAGRDDTEVYGYAWREKRVLLTHDHDFLDDKKFPEHRNPGVVVLPGGGGDQQALAEGLVIALRVFGTTAALWRKTKSTISASGEMTIHTRNFATGKIETSRFRLTRTDIEIWEQD